MDFSVSGISKFNNHKDQRNFSLEEKEEKTLSSTHSVYKFVA